MSAYASVRSYTYTRVDIRDVFNQLAADLDMIARATGVATDVEDVVHDLIVLGQNDYISRVDLVLHDSDGVVVRVNKYTCSTSAGGWRNDRPGGNAWPRTPGGRLEFIVDFTEAWKSRPATFERDQLRLTIGTSTTDTSYPSLVGIIDRHYARNGYGLERTAYRRL